MSRPNSKANEDYYSNEELCPNCHTNEKLNSEKISMSGKIYCKNCGWEGVLDDLVFKQADGSYGKESKASETQDDFDWLNEDDDRFTATMWEQSDGTWIVNSEGSQFDSSFTTRFTDSVDAHKYMDKVNRGELTKDDLYNDQMSGYRILEPKAS